MTARCKPSWHCASCCSLSFARRNCVRREWTEIDFDKAEWRIPAERMKMQEQHIVPLSSQAVAVLRELQKHTGNRQYLFPNQHKPISFMSENTMLYALYRMGYHSRTHRATAFAARPAPFSTSMVSCRT